MRCSTWQGWKREASGLPGASDRKGYAGTHQTGRWAPKGVSHRSFKVLQLLALPSFFPLPDAADCVVNEPRSCCCSAGLQKYVNENTISAQRFFQPVCICLLKTTVPEARLIRSWSQDWSRVEQR